MVSRTQPPMNDSLSHVSSGIWAPSIKLDYLQANICHTRFEDDACENENCETDILELFARNIIVRLQKETGIECSQVRRVIAICLQPARISSRRQTFLLGRGWHLDRTHHFEYGICTGR